MSNFASGLRVANRLQVNMGSFKRNKRLGAAAYYGGKSELVSKYIPMFPDHPIYVEPFGGSASILLNKPLATIEIYNDLEEGVYSFFHCLRNPRSSKKLIEQLELTPYSRQEHDVCVGNYGGSVDAIEKARRWYVASQSSYSSILGSSFRTARTKPCANIWRRRIERLGPVIERLRRVTIENMDFEAVLKKYDTKNSFAFIDPPYVHSTRNGGTSSYEHEMTDSDHRRLLSVVGSLKGLVMVCGYSSPAYAEALKGWHVVDTFRRNAVGKSRIHKIERIWMNYRLSDEL
jgi:DNA adenine methylase